MSWVDRIAARLNDLGWSQAELARRSGVPHTTIRKYLSANGAAVKQPKAEKLKRIAHALGTTPEWILFGVGSGKIAIADLKLPVWRLSCLGGAMEDGVRSAREDVPKIAMVAPPGAMEGDLWVEVDDPAMAPDVPHGAFVLLSREMSIRPGDLVVVKHVPTEVYLLRKYRIVSIIEGRRTISLTAANPVYGEIISSDPDEYQVIGRVIFKLIRT